MTKIFIDPGHGGKDPGCISGGIKEADLVWSISAHLKNVLELLGVFAGMSRSEIENPSHIERNARAKKSNAQLVVSVHCDSSPLLQVSGMRVYYTQNNNNTKKTAQTLQRLFVGSIPPPDVAADKKISQAFAAYSADKNTFPRARNVLNAYSSDAIIVECCFISNQSNLEEIQKETVQKQLALSIAHACIAHVPSVDD